MIDIHLHLFEEAERLNRVICTSIEYTESTLALKINKNYLIDRISVHATSFKYVL